MANATSDSRESWIMKNVTSKNFSMGDLPLVPAFGPGSVHDLLQYYTSDKIRTSTNLKTLINNGWLKLVKKKDGISTTFTGADALKAINPQEENDISSKIDTEISAAQLSGGGGGSQSITDPLFVFGPLMTNYVYKNVLASLSASGDNTIYTVPTGKKCLILSMLGVNTSGGSTTITTFGVISGVTFPYNIGLTISSTGFASSTMINKMVLNAGDAFIVNTTAAGLNAFLSLVEFDASSPLSGGILSQSFGTSQTVLMTCPSNKRRHIFSQTASNFVFSNGANSAISVKIGSGGSPGYGDINFILSGDSLSSNNKFYRMQLVQNQITSFPAPLVLNAGDSLSAKMDTLTGGVLYAMWADIDI